jgi:hypothetical protein
MKAPRNTITAPAMSRDEWQDLPAEVKRFIPWERAREPLTVKTVKPPARVTRWAGILRDLPKGGK